MKKNQVTIEIDKKGRISMHSIHPVNFEDFMTMFCTLALGMMKNMLHKAPKDSQKTCKDFLYDSFNVAVSKVLSLFAPEYELRPNLTAQAIKEAEDKIIMEGRLKDVEPGT